MTRETARRGASRRGKPLGDMRLYPTMELRGVLPAVRDALGMTSREFEKATGVWKGSWRKLMDGDADDAVYQRVLAYLETLA